MQVDQLTIGEVKSVLEMFGKGSNLDESASKSDSMFQAYIGRYVIVRSRNEGINAGYVEFASDKGIMLREARRIWWYKPADSSQAWYEGVANSGVSEDSKLSPIVRSKLIVEDYSITDCRPEAIDSIRECKSHACD